MSNRRQLGDTSLLVHPLCLGGNVFAWTAGERESHAVLDAYVAQEGNFLDTSDAYSRNAPGGEGGDSERVIGGWLARRRNRADMVIGTKVGAFGGLSYENVMARVDASLARLRTDYVDLLYAHLDDLDTPLEESLAAFAEVVRSGRARYIAASNFAPRRLTEALEVSSRHGFPRFVALQTQYNLLERTELMDDRFGTGGFEGPLGELCQQERLACIPYWALAKGFLTGKYRSESSARATGGFSLRADYYRPNHVYGDERGIKVLGVLDEVAARHRVPVAAATLAWTAAQPGVVAPVASARTVDQLRELMAMTRVQLSPGELASLDAASTATHSCSS